MKTHEDGILVGPYNARIRDYYMKYRVERYLIDHPGASRSQASKIARVSWRRKVKIAIQRREQPAKETS